MLSGISRKRSMRSKSCWFAEFCNLQCLSHFAAPFIVVRAEASVAESCEVKSFTRNEEVCKPDCNVSSSAQTKKACALKLRQRPEFHISKRRDNWDIRVNDPSAGSPTETLLRLLLPLSDKVHETSHCSSQELSSAAVRMIHRITQSVGATGGVYKGQGRNQHELMTRAY